MNKDLLQVLTNILQTLPKEDKTEQKFEALFSEIEKLKEYFTKKTDDEFLTINEVCRLKKDFLFLLESQEKIPSTRKVM